MLVIISMPIDYSKWDNLEVSSSDDDDDDDYNDDDTMTTPRVTRLDAPSKVTFGGNNNNSTAAHVNIEPSSSSISTPTPQALIANTKTVGSSGSAPPASWTERGGLVTVTTGNRKLYWTQDRYSVTLRLELNGGGGEGESSSELEEEKVQSVDVDGILPYSDRFSAVGSTKPILRCQSKSSRGGIVVLEGELPHPVHLAEEDDDGVVDWSVDVRDDDDDNSNKNSCCCRFLMITLYKAVPMQGLSVWWRRPLMEFPELLDLDRARGVDPNNSSSGTGTATASQDFLKTWEEAHKIFREEKMKKKNANANATAKTINSLT